MIRQRHFTRPVGLLLGLLVGSPESGMPTRAAVIQDAPASASASFPDGPAEPTPDAGLTQAIDVDLATDPLKGFEAHGPVTWEAGKLGLAPGGKLLREIELGAEVKLTLDLQFAPLAIDGQKSTTRFGFLIRDRGEFVAVITRRRDGGRTFSEIGLVDQDTPINMADVTRTIRTDQWEADLPSGPWTFRLHHGLFTVYCGAKRLAIGYSDKEPGQYPGNPRRQLPFNAEFYRYFGVDEPLEVTGWRLEQQGLGLACGQIDGKAALSYKTTVGPTFLEKMQKNSRLVATYSSSDECGDLLARCQKPLQPGGNDGFLNFGPKSSPDYRELMVRDCLGEKHPYNALVLRGRGMQLQWDRRDAAAQDFLERAVTIADESLGDWHPDRISTIVSLGKLYREIGRFDLAEPLLTKAADASRQTFPPKEPRLVSTLEELAKLYQLTDRLADAETLLREIQGQAPEGKSRGSAVALLQLGDQQNRLGEREKAAALYAQATKILAEIADGAMEQYRLERRLDIFQIYVDLTAAQIRQAWIMRDDGRAAEARTLAREAFLHMVQFARGTPMKGGKFSAWESEIRTVQPSERMMQHPDYSRVMIRLADLFVALGDFIPARASIAVTDRVSNNILSRRDSSILYRTTAKLYENQPKFDLGLWPGHLSERQRLDFVVKSCKAKNDDDEADRQRYIASAQLARPGDKLPEAEAKEIRKRLSRPVGLPRGLQPDDDLPADYALDWLKIATREFEATSGPGHPETIEVMLSQARRQWKLQGPKLAEPILGEASSRTADFTAKILPGLPETQAYSYLESSRHVLDLLLSCYRTAPEARDRDAYEAVWLNKGMATRQVMDRRILLQAAATGSPELKKVAAELRVTRERLASLSLYTPPAEKTEVRQERLAELTSRKEDLEREVARLADSFRRTQAVDRASIADMIHGLPRATAVVDFVERQEWTPPEDAANPWNHSRTYDAFVIRDAAAEPGWTATWVNLGNADEIDRLLRDWVAEIRLGRDGARSLGDQVQQRLWAPIDEALTGCKTVILIPEGQLAVVPWAALPGKKVGSYLIEELALAQVPFGQFIARFAAEGPPSGVGALLLGGVDYGQPVKWGALPGTTLEVQQLAAFWPSGQAIRLGDQAATKRRLIELAPNRRFIHLATHGEFLDTGPERDRSRFLVVDQASGGAVYDVSARNPLLLTMLVLSGANRPVRTDKQGLPIDSDSFITAEEVMGLDLGRTELVVLSACDTGIGKIRGSAGVFSLQRAFHVAGSRSVLASLWQISDKSTQVLMQRFYDNLLSKKMSKIEALREAQIWMLREGVKHPELIRGLDDLPDPQPARKGATVPPYYWAAFVLSGDWR